MISSYADRLIFVSVALVLSVLAVPHKGVPRAITSPGCGSDTPWVFDYNDHSDQAIGDRSFLVHLPQRYNLNTPHPVVLSFHGYGEDDLQQERISGFSKAGNTIDDKVRG